MTLQNLSFRQSESIPVASFFQHPNQSPEGSHLTSSGKGVGGLLCSLVAQMVEHLSTMRETWVQSLGREDSLEEEMAARSSILAWRIPWTEEPGGLQFIGSQSRT